MERGLDIELRFLAQEFKNISEGKGTQYSSINKLPQHSKSEKKITKSNSIRKNNLRPIHQIQR